MLRARDHVGPKRLDCTGARGRTKRHSYNQILRSQNPNKEPNQGRPQRCTDEKPCLTNAGGTTQRALLVAAPQTPRAEGV